MSMQDDGNFYHSVNGYVHVGKWMLEIDAIWRGIDVVERKGVPLDAIANALTWDWDVFVPALAQLGRRRP